MMDLLLIAYHYPPMASAGIERSRSFVRHLPGRGYRPHVLTTSTYGGSECAEVYRASELLEIYRLIRNPAQRSLEPEIRSRSRTESGSVISWFKRNLLIPDGQIGWFPHALYKGLKAIQRHGIRGIVSSAPPYSSHLLGMAIQGITGLPWVVDFRDAWTYDPLDPALQPGTVRYELECALEQSVIQRADRIVCVSDVARDDLQSRFPHSSEKICVIPNGFEPGELPDVSSEYEALDRPIQLVHTGSFSYSHEKRSLSPLLDALQSLYHADNNLSELLRLVLVGSLSEEEHALVAPLVDAGIVLEVGAVPRSEALQWQNKADVLLLVDHPRTVPASNIPTKCYEYMAARKPILALVPRGATRDLVADLQAGICVSPVDSKEIRKGIEQLVNAGRAGEFRQWRVSSERLKHFSRAESASALAACLDHLLTT